MHIYIKNNDHNNEDTDDINDKLHLNLFCANYCIHNSFFKPRCYS